MKTKLLSGVSIVVCVVALFAVQQSWSRSEASHVGKNVENLTIAKFLGQKPDWKGKVVLLEFWATWCPPCRASIPHLNQLYGKFKDKGLVAIGVSNEDESTVKKFLEKLPIDYYVGLDKNLGKTYKVTGIPHALLINRKGVIVWEGHPMQLKEADLEKVLAENAKTQ